MMNWKVIFGMYAIFVGIFAMLSASLLFVAPVALPLCGVVTDYSMLLVGTQIVIAVGVLLFFKYIPVWLARRYENEFNTYFSFTAPRGLLYTIIVVSMVCITFLLAKEFVFGPGLSLYTELFMPEITTIPNATLKEAFNTCWVRSLAN